MIRIKNITSGTLSIYIKGGGCVLLRPERETWVDEDEGSIKLMLTRKMLKEVERKAGEVERGPEILIPEPSASDIPVTVRAKKGRGRANK